VKSSPAFPRALAAIAALVVGVRLAVFCGIVGLSGLSPATVVAGHDGAEYIEFARGIAHGAPSAISADARRHDPGWPLFLAAFVWAGPMWLVIPLCDMGLSVLSAVFTAFICRNWMGASDREALMVALAAGVAYPSAVYFSAFALAEPLFGALLVAALLAWCGQKRGLGYLLAGLAALVRAPGLLMAAAFLTDDLFRRRPLRAYAAPALAILPQAVWLIVARSVWGVTQIGIHRPEFGLPLAGFQGMAQAGTARAAYILLVVAVAAVLAALLARESRRSPQNPPLLVAAVFCITYLSFHLCLRRLTYLGGQIFTFSYQDRYLVGMLPFVLLPFGRALRPWLVGLLCAASVAASLYWGANYFQAVREQKSQTSHSGMASTAVSAVASTATQP
jgi:hypothetical protein